MDNGFINRGSTRNTDYSQAVPRSKFRIVRADEPTNQGTADHKAAAKRILSRRQKTILIVAGVLILAGAGLALGLRERARSFALPASHATVGDFKAYVPRNLPDGYTLDTSSLQSDGGILLFVLENKTKSTRIVFSEQIKPADYDFDNFNTKVLKNSRELQGTPYQSTLGSGDKNSKILSIVTDDVWVIASTAAATPDEDIVSIASQLHRQ